MLTIMKPMTDRNYDFYIIIDKKTHIMKKIRKGIQYENACYRIHIFKRYLISIIEEDIEYIKYYKKSIRRRLSHFTSECGTVLYFISYSGNYELFKLLCTRNTTKRIFLDISTMVYIIIHFIYNYTIGDNLEILKNIISKSFTISEILYYINNNMYINSIKIFYIDEYNPILSAYQLLLDNNLLII